MPKTVNETLLDAAIRHQVYLQRYSTGQVREMVCILNEAEKALREKLMSRLESIRQKGFDSGPFSTAKLDRELKEVKALQASAMAEIERRFTGEMVDFAEYEADHQAAALKKAVPIKLSTAAIPAERLSALALETPYAGRTLTEWAKKFSDDDWQLIRGNVRTGILEGATTQDIVRRIFGTAGKKYEDAARRTTRRNLETLVRTAVNHTATTTREAVAHANSSVVKGMEWVSTLDGRTSIICGIRDGKVWPLNEGPRPPAHPNCRSVMVVQTKSWRELGLDAKETPPRTRASMNGQVPAKKKYSDWLRDQSPEFQDEVLGRSRGKLFREGGLKLDRFVDRSGKTLNLRQLGETEGFSQTWKSMGLKSSKEVSRRKAPNRLTEKTKTAFASTLKGKITDYDGTSVSFGESFYKHVVTDKPSKENRGYLFEHFKQTVESPDEVWLYTRDEDVRKAYIGFFADGEKPVNIIVVADGSEEKGWKGWTAMQNRTIDSSRKGKLLYQKK